jgi:hypothetical protein
MASDRQIAANRKNALKSTGPVSSLGKSRSRKNAICHGLAIKIDKDLPLCAEVERIAEALSRGFNQSSGGSDIAMGIRGAAEAEVDLLRIRKIGASIHQAFIESAKSVKDVSKFNEKMRKLDRYERRAFSRRQRALK